METMSFSLLRMAESIPNFLDS